MPSRASAVGSIAAREIEGIVEEALTNQRNIPITPGDTISDQIERVVLSENCIRIALRAHNSLDGSPPDTIEVPRDLTKLSRTHAPPPSSDRKLDQTLLFATVRAHAWLADLTCGRCSSIEDLANDVKLHPKVVRQALRLAYLSPDLTSAIVEGGATGKLDAG